MLRNWSVPADAVIHELLGWSVVPSSILPLEQSVAEQARAIVRHGMKDVVLWLGLPLGPEPGAVTHAMADPLHLRVFVSENFWRMLEDSLPTVGDNYVARTPSGNPMIDALYRMLIGQQLTLALPRDAP